MPNLVNGAYGLPYPCHPIYQQRVLGCVSEIDYRNNVGTESWENNHPPRIQKLSALRRAHMLRKHQYVKMEMEKRGYERAVEIKPAEWVDICETFEARDRKKR